MVRRGHDTIRDRRYTEHMFMTPGLTHHPTVVDEAQQAWLARWIHRIPEEAWEEIRLRGVLQQRRVLAFGWHHLSVSDTLEAAPPIPPPLLRLRNHLARMLTVDLTEHHQAVLTRYEPGAGMARHVDPQVFHEPIVALCLGGSGRLRFTRQGYQPCSLRVDAGDAYQIAGAARRDWQHELLPVADTRWSITFRCARGR